MADNYLNLTGLSTYTNKILERFKTIDPSGNGVVTVNDGEPNIATSIMLGRNVAVGETDDHIVIGTNTNSQGANAISVGFDNISRGAFSVAIGKWAETYSSYGVALGYNASSKSDGTISIGVCATTLATKAIALGNHAIANRPHTLAIMQNATAAGDSSIAIGKEAAVSGENSIAFGYNAKISQDNTIQLGDENISKLQCKVEVSTFSDFRDKADVEAIDDGAVEFLKRIKAIRYKFNARKLYIDSQENLSDKDKENFNKYGLCSYDKDAHAKGTKKGERVRVGVLAQEVQEALKEVYGDSSYGNLVDDNFYDLKRKPTDVENQLTITYSNFIPFLIKAIQEQQDQIESDRQLIAELQNRISVLEK